MYCSFPEQLPSDRFRCEVDLADPLVSASPASVEAVPVQSIVVKNLNVTVPVRAKLSPVVIEAVSYTPDPTARCALLATVASLAAFFSVVAEDGVALSIMNGSQELTAYSL